MDDGAPCLLSTSFPAVPSSPSVVRVSNLSMALCVLSMAIQAMFPPATFPSIRRSGRTISLIFTHRDILTVRLLAAFQASRSKPAWTRLKGSDPKGKDHRPPPPGQRSSLMRCVRWVSESGVFSLLSPQEPASDYLVPVFPAFSLIPTLRLLPMWRVRGNIGAHEKDETLNSGTWGITCHMNRLGAARFFVFLRNIFPSLTCGVFDHFPIHLFVIAPEIKRKNGSSQRCEDGCSGRSTRLKTK
jgi:hypothetical protein